MKDKIKYLGTLLVGLLLFTACEINDPIGDIVRTGNFVSNVYYEVPNTNNKAGSSVEFYAEYWSEGDQFKSMGLWYSIETELQYSITSGINVYNFTLDSMELAREPQMIVSYQHSVDSFSVEKKAYVIRGAFPISSTLAPVLIKDPQEYNEVQVQKFFPNSVIDRFLSGLFQTMDYELLKDVLVVKSELIDSDTFETHFDIVEETDPDTGEMSTTKVLKEGSAPILLALLKQVPLQDLVYDPIDFKYKANYSKSYKLMSKFSVINGNDLENFSEEKVITVN